MEEDPKTGRMKVSFEELPSLNMIVVEGRGRAADRKGVARPC